MSIASARNINGHPSKRRKMSHDSNEQLSRNSKPFLETANHEADSSDISDQSDEEDTTTQNISKPRNPAKSQKSTLTAIPTSVSSSTLMIQAQRLLNDTKPDHSARLRQSMPTADKIIGIMKSMPTQQPMSFSEAQNYSQKTLRVTIPWTQRPATSVKYTFHFITPSSITAQGPLIHHLTLRDSPTTIIIVPEMPAEIFQEKDYLNYRCLHKQAFFLACITAALKQELIDDFDFKFAFPQGNHLSCVLQIIDKNNGKVAYEVNPSFPETVGPVRKMAPTHTCVRKSELADDSNDDMTEEMPFYNSTVRWLSSRIQYHRLIKEASTKADSFQDACLLATNWLDQRDFSSDISRGGFGVEEWSLICALLLKSGGHQGQPLFSPRYSAVQFFKAMLQVLSGRDMFDAFVVRGCIKLTQTLSIPIFLDASTSVNLLYKMTPWSYATLKHYATLSLASLNSKKLNTFDANFTTRASDPTLQFDETYQFSKLGLSESSSDAIQQQSKLYKLLKKGLGDRVSTISIASAPASPWKTTSSTPQQNPTAVTVGILINADTITRLVDHGPSVEEKEASEAFRSFWGDKSELRRFKDGRICESLVWGAHVPVTQQIIHWICHRHLGLSTPDIRSTASLENIRLQSEVPAEEAFVLVNNNFQTLSSTLHHLEGLPLPIRSVTAASEVTHSSSLIHPLQPGVAQPIDVVIQFDSSGRWPDNLQAIQFTKIAFLTKIGDLLTKQDRKLEVRVGLENASTSSSGHFNTSYLDVIHPSTAPILPPLVFRLRIYHDREVHLIQSSLSDKTLRPPEREQLQYALQYLKQHFLASPSHNTAIHSLLTQFPPLSITIRLLKSWISAHHLSQHISPEVLEIIAAHIFLFPAPWSAPGTPTLAFTRCLHFLSRWDWSTKPLITDLSPAQDMTIEVRQDLEARFAAWRQMDPNMNSVTWFIGTNLDNTGVVWTQGVGGAGSNPPRVIASRLTALASAAITQLTTANPNSIITTPKQWTTIFTPTLSDYDFTIHLLPSILPHKSHHTNHKPRFKNLQLASTLNVDTTGLDTVNCYLTDLTSSFGSVALFCYGAKHAGGHVIGGLWRPHVRAEKDGQREWKIRLGVSSVPVRSAGEAEVDAQAEVQGMCKVNFEGMLAEMGMMGEGVVERIVMKGG